MLEGLDLSAILQAQGEEHGQPPYHPGRLVTLLLYWPQPRRIFQPPTGPSLRRREDHMDFMAMTGLNWSDFRTVSDFRERHLPTLSDLLVQAPLSAAGLVKLGHVAVGGTKLRANASRQKAMSYQRMVAEEPKLAANVKA